MQFRKYLNEESVFLDQSFKTVDEALSFIAGRFSVLTGVGEDRIHQLLADREKLSSTWIGSGAMLPHNHSPEIRDLHMVFIRLREPLILDEGHEVRYIFSILTSGSQEQVYLSILQGISRLMQEKNRELEVCATPADLFSLMATSDFLAGRPLCAADLAKEWPIIRSDEPLGKALDLMKKHDVFFLPVLNPEGTRLAGVLDLVDLLKAGFPDFVFSLYDFSMITDFKPVKYFWKNEDKLVTGDFTRDYRPYLVPADASYPEIFFLMIKGNRRHLLVLNRQDELCGVIHPSQIINTMLRP